MKTKIINELKRIAEQNDGILQPEVVVEKARPINSPLHNQFEWNNTKAAREYRIWQARQLIRVSVEVIAGIKDPVDVFISLSGDRKRDGGGYRIMADVLSDKQMREEMLRDALEELGWFREKYARLRQLAVVFKAIKRVRHGKAGRVRTG